MSDSPLSGRLAFLSSFPVRADELDRGWDDPPASAKPWAYWFVMDGNFRREGITADLEAMKRVGIGGVLFMEVDVGIPRGPVPFMSPEWRELFKHANTEAARLGLMITMPASPGWTGSGGPWVKPEQSMQKLVCERTGRRRAAAVRGHAPATGRGRRVLPRRRSAGLSLHRPGRTASPTSTRRPSSTAATSRRSAGVKPR